jgi:hypothetical protein
MTGVVGRIEVLGTAVNYAIVLMPPERKKGRKGAKERL